MLRNRILLGVLPLLLLLILVGGYAVLLFVRLGSAVNTTLHENYLSIAAMQNLKESVFKIDHAFDLYKSGAITPLQLDQAVATQTRICQKSVSTELGNITEPGEQEIANQLKASTDNLLTNVSTNSDNRNKTNIDLEPQLNLVLRSALSIQKLNEEAMVRADKHARDTAKSSTHIMLVTLAVAIPLSIFFAYRLSSFILRPISDLTRSAQELGEGNLDQVLPVYSQDELGQLAVAFNKMAGKLRLYRQTKAEELLQARQVTEATFAALPDPIIVFSSDGVITYQNIASEKLRKNLSTAENTLPIVPLAMRVLGGKGDYLPNSFEAAFCARVDGSEKFFLPKVIGLKEGSAGVVVILQDVTRFRLIDDIKTNLVATVSHELKTPLTSMRMAVYLLLEERVGSLNAKQNELLVAARDDAERLLDLINNLLNIAKLEAGVGLKERQWVQPEELISKALQDSQEYVTLNGLTLTSSCDSNLSKVFVVPEQISQVFVNLISNAVKHSQPGNEIHLDANQLTSTEVRFSVVDHGSGIPPHERERIFEKFYRLPGESKTGVGLGLAICKEIINAHGGVIGVVSNLKDKGSEFFFTLSNIDNASKEWAPSTTKEIKS